MKNRITITISEDLLKHVDDTIDNRTIRNRSQAIETLLRQVLSPTVKTAVILAGGSLAKHPQSEEKTAKALIPIKDRPVISHILNHLSKHGFTKAIICVSPNSRDKIKSIIRDGREYGIAVEYSEEPEKLGTGGALKHAAPLIPEEPFLLMHGDILTDINLEEFIHFFNEGDTKAALAIKPRPGRLSYGRVFLEGSSIIDFKVPEEASPISLVNTGIYIFDYEVLSMLPEDKTNFKIEETLIPDLVKQGEVSGSVFQGIWFDVSESESYQEANDRWVG